MHRQTPLGGLERAIGRRSRPFRSGPGSLGAHAVIGIVAATIPPSTSRVEPIRFMSSVFE